MLQVMPSTVPVWPVAGDVPDLKVIIADQAATITANAALIAGYQTDLNAATNPPPGAAATANGTTAGSSTTLVVAAPVNGTIGMGATVTGAGVPTTPAATVLGQISGTAGKDGTYLLSAPVNLATATPLTFTPLPPPSTWPTPTDAPTLLLISQQQVAILRNQNALLQHYVDLLNTSQTPAPPTGP